MNKIVALTGATGAMGGEVLKSLLESDRKLFVKILLYAKDKKRIPKFIRKILKENHTRVAVYYGDFSDPYSCENFVRDADYLVHCAAVIPPHSDHDIDLAKSGNFDATKNLVDAVISTGNKDKTKFINIASVSLYGNRNFFHPFARIGDPVMPSVYDFYAYYKMLSERYVIESDLKAWVSLRQTAVLHKYLFANNLSDGLMFHTPWNTPFEWVTDRDSGLLIKNLIEKDMDGSLTDFWNKCFDIGGGESCRVTGYETINDAFKITGKQAKSYFEPKWNAARNFHGVWFADSDELNDYLDFQTESSDDFWKRMGRKYWYFVFARLVPASWIKKGLFNRLLKDNNAPDFWIKNNMDDRVRAFYGSYEQYEQIPSDWERYPLLCEGNTGRGTIDYERFKQGADLKENGLLLSHGYDEMKPDCELDIEDMKSAAEFRGGRCISESMTAGDLHTKLMWQCADGHTFWASPYAVLKAGYWCSECDSQPWRYEELSKTNRFFAQVWYDSHTADESVIKDVKKDEEKLVKEGRYAHNNLRFFWHR